MMDMALTKSRFIALLVNRHIRFTHGGDPLAAPFIAALKKNEPIWLKQAEVGKKELDQAYELLEFCDALSPLICQSLIPPEGRRIEISRGPDGTSYTLFQDQDRIIVESWPFTAERFEVLLETRTIDRLKFSGDRQFKKMLRNIPVKIVMLELANR